MIGFTVCDKGEAEYEGSRFFGDPVVPEKWAMKEPWPEDFFFMCQINLADLKGMDTGSLLPDRGYLYFFADAESDVPDLRVYYTDKEPDTIYEECNMGFDEDVDYDLFTDYVIKFGEDGCGYVLGSEGDDVILMEYDPSRSEADVFRGFGRIRVIIPKDALAERDLSKARTEAV